MGRQERRPRVANGQPVGLARSQRRILLDRTLASVLCSGPARTLKGSGKRFSLEDNLVTLALPCFSCAVCSAVWFPRLPSLSLPPGYDAYE